jgi:hypothetical protein
MLAVTSNRRTLRRNTKFRRNVLPLFTALRFLDLLTGLSIGVSLGQARMYSIPSELIISGSGLSPGFTPTVPCSRYRSMRCLHSEFAGLYLRALYATLSLPTACFFVSCAWRAHCRNPNPEFQHDRCEGMSRPQSYVIGSAYVSCSR